MTKAASSTAPATSMSSPHLVVVVGSGTDAGKTYVAARLVEDLVARGLVTRVRKPVVSGFVDDDASDPARLLRAAHHPARVDEPLARVSPWRFLAPVSPDAAARAEGVVVDFDAVVAAVVDVDDGTEVVVVETAGGVMSPLTEVHTQIDLVRSLAARVVVDVVVVVDGSYLGAFSHGLSAVAVAESCGGVVAVVVNKADVTAFDTFVRFLPGRTVLGSGARAALADRITARVRASR